MPRTSVSPATLYDPQMPVLLTGLKSSTSMIHCESIRRLFLHLERLASRWGPRRVGRGRGLTRIQRAKAVPLRRGACSDGWGGNGVPETAYVLGFPEIDQTQVPAVGGK